MRKIQVPHLGKVKRVIIIDKMIVAILKTEIINILRHWLRYYPWYSQFKLDWLTTSGINK